MDITFLITDTHFGVKQNSITWLNSQLDFIYKQLIPKIQEERNACPDSNIKLIHMGDVFDSRSSISTYVAAKVVEVFKDLSDIISVHIIAGNHDYYSPTSDSVNTLNLLLSDAYVHLHTKYVWQNPNSDGTYDLFIPWYKWGDNITQAFLDKGNIKNIFTHADIVNEKLPHKNLKNVKVFSGHVHIPYIKNNLYNIGSCYSLDFADSNSLRGFYILRDGKLEFYPNEHSIKFWKLYNEDLLDIPTGIGDNDYIEVYISQSNMINEKYQSIIIKLVKKYNHIWIIPQPDTGEVPDIEQFEGYDIEKLTKTMIPKELNEKFDMVLKNV